MVEDRLTDGKRIAQFVASEVEGHEDLPLGVSDADPDVEPTEDGALAYRIVRTGADGEKGEDGDAVAEVYVHPDRARAEFVAAVDVAAEAADAEGLRVRPKAVRPPRTLVFVEDGAQVKWLLPALRAVAEE
ncbi:hypothetical protein [Halopelagius fulvigenes]|uniref:DUF7993 domain-containing protein n=1 Tax=Halopelagius fulvigenes TaxID=1198324 RepID=A0ABD5TUQ9_9EURY